MTKKECGYPILATEYKVMGLKPHREYYSNSVDYLRKKGMVFDKDAFCKYGTDSHQPIDSHFNGPISMLPHKHLNFQLYSEINTEYNAQIHLIFLLI